MSFARLRRSLQGIALVALPAVALACGDPQDIHTDADAAVDAGVDAGIDANGPFTQTFTVQQPAAPALQQLINSCASGVEASCLEMCRQMFCKFGEPFGDDLHILACELHRDGPFANITVTWEGQPQCISPGDLEGVR
jgi:hypothetical protein